MADERAPLTVSALQAEAASFARVESTHDEPTLYGVTDGKAVGTYLEHKFQAHLLELYLFGRGNSAKGIDIPDLNVDIKVTSVNQSQSSCPFRNARQKVYGLGYSLLIFVYQKSDDPVAQTARLQILHTIFVESQRTADFQTSHGLRRILEAGGNKDDVLAFFDERMLPLDEVGASVLADEVIASPPEAGFLTISNALQWRLQYSRVIAQADTVGGIMRLT